MVAHIVQGPRLTVEQYLAMERESNIRHEFIGGYVYAMAGGTRRHDRIARNVLGLLDHHLGDGPCQAYTLNMKVRLATDGQWTTTLSYGGEDVMLASIALTIPVDALYRGVALSPR